MVRPSREYQTLSGGRSRQIEDWGFVVAIVLMAIRGLSELLHEWAAMLVELRPHPHPWPWAFLISVLVVALPKFLGRATAGKVWESIGAGLGRLVGRGRPAGPGESDGTS